MIPDPANGRLKAGELIHHVAVQSPVLTTLPSGGVTVSGWTTVVMRWASVEALTGREFWSAQQVQADTTHLIKMRPVAGADATWSVLWQGRRYEFAEAPRDPVGDGEQVQVLAVLKTS